MRKRIIIAAIISIMIIIIFGIILLSFKDINAYYFYVNGDDRIDILLNKNKKCIYNDTYLNYVDEKCSYTILFDKLTIKFDDNEIVYEFSDNKLMSISNEKIILDIETKNISVFLKIDSTLDNINEIDYYFKNNNYIDKYIFTSKEDSKNQMIENDPSVEHIFEFLDENPLLDSYYVILKSDEYYNKLINELNEYDFIEDIKVLERDFNID